MPTMLPVFRSGRYRQVKDMVTDGRITREHLQQIADNTNRMISETKFRPPLKLGHGAGRKAIGWIDGLLEVRGDHLYAPLGLNEEGKRLVKAKQVRFVSAEIDQGRTLFGDEDSDRLGLRLGAVAALEADAPAIKDLCDLTTDVTEFHEYETRDESGEWATAYFAEVEFNEQKPDEQGNGGDMADTQTPDAGAQFAELKEQNAKMQADLAELTAALAEAKQREKEAHFREEETRFATFGESLMKDAKTNAPQLDRAKKFAAKLIRGEAVTLAEFEDVLKHAPNAVSTRPIPVEDAPAQPESGVTLAMFEEAILNADAAAKIMLAVAERRKTVPNFTDRDLYAELARSN
jgi:hypothetical protein